MAEIRSEMAAQHVAAGRQLYETRKFTDAIKEWKTAVDYGYDPRAADQLVARAKEQMRREDIAKASAAKEIARRQEAAKKEAEAKAAEEKEAADKAAADKAAADKAAATTATNTGQPGTTATGPTGQATGTANGPTAAPTGPVSDESKRQSEQHYLSGMIYYQKQDYENARNEWTLAKKLDPTNPDAAAGLDRIEKLLNGGQ
jgi:tetratricopeptide (TPR) repeat protein